MRKHISQAREAKLELQQTCAPELEKLTKDVASMLQKSIDDVEGVYLQLKDLARDKNLQMVKVQESVEGWKKNVDTCNTYTQLAKDVTGRGKSARSSKKVSAAENKAAVATIS